MNQLTRFPLAISVLVAAGSFAGHSAQAQFARVDYQRARATMVEEVLVRGGIKNPAVLKAMGSTPRHEFLEQKNRAQAYLDMAIPIGEKQTISSPFTVAFMTEAIDPQPTDVVLEIGTGSGYQAAVLSPLVKEVYTIEIVKLLGERAERALKRLKYKNVTTKVGDGYQGWKEHAPFDKIIVTCSPEKAPQPLVDQLKEGGLMVIPVGERYQQIIYLMRKTGGKMVEEALMPILFVPMTGAAEEGREVKPDPLNPKIVNGEFEEPPGKGGFVPGWYYHQQVALRQEPGAPEGKSRHVVFSNAEPGRSAFMLQGFPVDGGKVRQLDVSVRIKLNNVVLSEEALGAPAAVISFHDENRRELGIAIIGDAKGTHDWRTINSKVKVPPRAREGLIRIGLHGCTGEASFDEVRMTPVR